MFFLLISMMFISYEDDKLFYALLWFVLPIWVWAALLVTKEIENPTFVMIHTVIIILWWILMVGHSTCMFFYGDNSGIQMSIETYLFLFIGGIVSSAIIVNERRKHL